MICLVALIVVAMVAYSLRRRGRPWWRNRYSQRVIDGWMVTHFGHGIVLYGLAKIVFVVPMLDLLSIVVIVETLWESVENRNWMIRLFRAGGDKNYFGDSILNSAGDVVACIAGALLTSMFI